MFNIFKLNIGFVISLFFLSSGYCSSTNSQLLDSCADSLNECICLKHPINISKIQKNLDFIEVDYDKFYIKKYADGMNFQQYILDNSNQQISKFASNCLSIYEANEEIDPVIQDSVVMLFAKVLDKYEQHCELRNSIIPLLPSNQKTVNKIGQKNFQSGFKNSDISSVSQLQEDISTR